MEYDETIKQMEEKHQYKLQQMEAEFQKRIMDEVERYQQLVQERDTMQEQQDQAQRSMIEEHKQMVSDVTKQYEAQLAQARGQRLKLQVRWQRSPTHALGRGGEEGGAPRCLSSLFLFPIHLVPALTAFPGRAGGPRARGPAVV